ncbi:hypothetical protein KFL_000500320 [Klebsormidium nitens]|uniref:CID domain-containing protein n=1 Tax=Klebsormidium nitens TaxID=105231 RepID=A0A1Y1HSV4_KLENI|nr:hypothetical protein KFL_000500320 [Klebsormidium nitens]|eukprot:GAQ80279.1 hypothetical protein KFL_000500320 [Klebsormidium nitens]
MDGFNEEILVEKLSKLNNSQTSIETLSHWCCFHRAKRSKQVVQIWGQEFTRAPTERKVTLLYLANDILQNSRKKGPEFVNEFWTVLPPLLTDKKNNGDQALQQAVARLAKIWDERKVFGSKGATLLQIVSPRGVSGAAPALSRSPSIKSIAGPAYAALITCLKAVHDASEEEKQALEESRAATRIARDLQQQAEAAAVAGRPPTPSLWSDLRTQQAALGRSTDRLRAFETKRTNTITLLSEALRKQETERTALRDEVKAAAACTQQAEQLRSRLEAGSAAAPNPSAREDPPGTHEPQMYSPTQAGMTGNFPPGYTATPPAQYAPPPPEPYQSEPLPYQSFHAPGVSEAPPGGQDVSAADFAASLAAIENPADLLQAFSSLSQEGLATLGNFAAFQEGVKRQRVEGPPQPGHYAPPGAQVANELGAGHLQGPPPVWHQSQEVHNYGMPQYQQHQ